MNYEIEYIGKKMSMFDPNKPINDIERLIVGEKMPQSDRITWPSKSSVPDWISGSIGFLDFIEVEKEEKFIDLYMIGIEPNYRRQGYATKLIKALEDTTIKRKISKIEVHGIFIENKPMLFLIEKLGYKQILGDEIYEICLPWREYLQEKPWFKSNCSFEKYLENSTNKI